MTQQDYRPAELYDEPPAAVPSIPRQMGRAVPSAEELHFEIKLDGEVIGVVYPKRLTGAAQLDLEDAKSTRHVIAWLKLYANADDDTLGFVERTLRSGPLDGVGAFVRTVAGALEHAIELSKTSGPR